MNTLLSIIAASRRRAAAAPMAFTALATLAATNNASSYTTPSYTPSANALVLAVVIVSGTLVVQPTYSGNGLTWVAVSSTLNDAGGNRLTVFRAMGGSPTAGAGTVSVSGGATNCVVRVVEFTNVKTTGSNGEDAVVQSASANGLSATAAVNLAALASSTNAVFVASGNLTVPYTGTPEGGFTEDYDGGAISPNTGLLTMYQLNATDNTPSITLTSQRWSIIALEISAP